MLSLRVGLMFRSGSVCAVVARAGPMVVRYIADLIFD